MKQALLDKKREKPDAAEAVEGDMEACEEEPQEEDPLVETGTQAIDPHDVCYV